MTWFRAPPQWTWHRLPLPAQRQTHGPRRTLSHRAAEAWDMSLLLVASWLLFSLLRYLKTTASGRTSHPFLPWDLPTPVQWGLYWIAFVSSATCP